MKKIKSELKGPRLAVVRCTVCFKPKIWNCGCDEK